MEITAVAIRTLGDKDVVHYYEVALLEQYWGKERSGQLQILEAELKNRVIDLEPIRRPLMDRVPKLDAVLEALWAGKLYKEEVPVEGSANEEVDLGANPELQTL